MPTYYHYDSDPCPECGEEMLGYAIKDSGAILLECDDLGAPGCGTHFGEIGEVDDPREVGDAIEHFISKYPEEEE